MQFVRQIFVPRDVNYGGTNNFFNTLNACNFCNFDGTEIQAIDGGQGFKWKYDSDEIKDANWYRGGMFWKSQTGGNWYLRFYHSQDDYNDTLINYSSNNWCFFFIPLKERGFFMSILDFEDANDYEGEPLTATPKLRNRDKGPFGGGNYEVYPVIGFYNNVDNRYNYLHFSSSQDFSRDFLDFKQRKVSFGTDITRDVENTKTDYKSNVCTLIKYPYENGFLNNLFIITTTPQLGCTWDFTRNIWTPNNNAAYGLSNKFFSFGGRNFYGIDSNLAVELPADNQR